MQATMKRCNRRGVNIIGGTWLAVMLWCAHALLQLLSIAPSPIDRLHWKEIEVVIVPGGGGGRRIAAAISLLKAHRRLRILFTGTGAELRFARNLSAELLSSGGDEDEAARLRSRLFFAPDPVDTTYGCVERGVEFMRRFGLKRGAVVTDNHHALRVGLCTSALAKGGLDLATATIDGHDDGKWIPLTEAVKLAAYALLI